MIDTTKILECWKDEIGWKNYFDTDQIPALDPALNVSNSGEFFNTFHPACALDVIQSILKPGQDLNQFLQSLRDDSIVKLANQIHDLLWALWSVDGVNPDGRNLCRDRALQDRDHPEVRA